MKHPAVHIEPWQYWTTPPSPPQMVPAGAGLHPAVPIPGIQTWQGFAGLASPGLYEVPAMSQPVVASDPASLLVVAPSLLSDPASPLVMAPSLPSDPASPLVMDPTLLSAPPSPVVVDPPLSPLPPQAAALSNAKNPPATAHPLPVLAMPAPLRSPANWQRSPSPRPRAVVADRGRRCTIETLVCCSSHRTRRRTSPGRRWRSTEGWRRELLPARRRGRLADFDRSNP
jgi:hypothetical protein